MGLLIINTANSAKNKALFERSDVVGNRVVYVVGNRVVSLLEAHL